MIAIGEQWIYQQRDTDPIHRVLIKRQVRNGQHPRYEVEFLDGDAAGQIVDIPVRRLHGRWEHREAYEANVARVARIEAFEPTETEAAAIEYVFELLVSEDVAHCNYSRAAGVSVVSDPAKLEELTGLATDELVQDIEWFKQDDYFVVSAEGGIRIAEAVCRRHPGPVLEWVDKQELKRRAECRRWIPADTERDVDPDFAWWYYREHDRHIYELLRQWCGHRAVTSYERIQAAEAETHRLDDLLDRVLHELHKTEPRLATDLAHEWDAERITSGSYRAVIDRPLKPHELPVQVQHRPRRWPRS